MHENCCKSHFPSLKMIKWNNAWKEEGESIRFKQKKLEQQKKEENLKNLYM